MNDLRLQKCHMEKRGAEDMEMEMGFEYVGKGKQGGEIKKVRGHFMRVVVGNPFPTITSAVVIPLSLVCFIRLEEIY